MKMIHYISAAYLLLSLVLVMARKHRQKFLALIPPICQIASILLLDSMEFPLPLTAVLVILNLALLFFIDMTEKKQMGLVSTEPEEQEYEGQTPSYGSSPTEYHFDNDFLPASMTRLGSEEQKNPVAAPPDLPEKPEESLTLPEVENVPINEVAPLQQEIFSASQNEMQEMIDQMIASGEMENAKRYLRMLAFFANDDASRKMAESKLAELTASAG